MQDFLGNELFINDIVVYDHKNNYGEANFRKGKIKDIIEIGIVIEVNFEDSSQYQMTLDCKSLIKINSEQTYENKVVLNGTVLEKNQDEWIFKTETGEFTHDVCVAIDEIIDRYTNTISKNNQKIRLSLEY